MSSARTALRRELRPMLALALPVALGEVGWMAMGVVDTMMVGRLGPEAIGGVSVGRALFMAVGVVGMGLLMGLDALVARNFGAGDMAGCRRWLLQGLYLSFGLALPLSLLVWAVAPLLDGWGMEPEVLPLAHDYLGTVVWSLLPIFLYQTFRRYLQGVHVVRPIMVALLSANLVNALTNWLLVFGNLGFPRLGVAGAGWATVFSTIYMAAFLGAIIRLHHRDRPLHGESISLRPDFERLRRALTLGAPASLQVALEFGAFAMATLLAGKLAAASLAAHQIALTMASVTFMVPLGISSAAAVRVGHAVGRRDPEGVGAAGWTAIGLGTAFMMLPALAFVLLPRTLLRIFTDDPGVMTVGVTLLAVAAVFQLFDAAQVVATGALRGVGDTRNPMLWNLIGHWLVGLPVGYYICFTRGAGVIGLWIGLSIGLIVVGVVLLVVWARRSRLAAHDLDALAA